MAVIGIEEIFLDVKDLEKAVDFYEKLIGIPVVNRNEERAFLQCERSHVVCRSRGIPAATAAADRCTSRSA